MKLLPVLFNLVAFLALAPLFDGVIRRVTARIQSRKGPPLVQPYYDLAKLLGKENLGPGNWAFHLAPLLALASILCAIALMPAGFRPHYLTERFDVITLVYLLTLGGVAVLLGALSSRNIFASIGASREMVTMVMVEPILAMSLIYGAVKVRSLGLFEASTAVGRTGLGISTVLMAGLFLLALQAFVGRQPFDLAEAESEIVEGPFIEYSGPNLALFKLYLMLKQMFYAGLFVILFLPFLGTGFFGIDVVIQAAGILLVFLLIGLVGATNPRFRIDQAVRYYAFLGAFALVAVGLSAGGL